jgi:hypothetical protein
MADNEWKEVTLTLRYRESALTPGGISRDEPETVEELVEEIDRQMNASHFGGQIAVAIKQPDVPLVGSVTADTVIVVDGDIGTLEM